MLMVCLTIIIPRTKKLKIYAQIPLKYIDNNLGCSVQYPHNYRFDNEVRMSDTERLHGLEFATRCNYPSWIAPRDLKIKQFGKTDTSSVIVSPHQSARVDLEIGKHDLPAVNLETNVEMLNCLRFSTRSCLAQSGSFLYKEDIFNRENIATLTNKGSLMIGATLKNFGANPIKFEAGDLVGRLFHTNDIDKIKGEELISLIKNGVVEGEEGRDFRILRNKCSPNSCLPYAIALKTSPDRFYIPKNGHGEAIRINGRSDVYSLIKKVDQNFEKESNGDFNLLVTSQAVNLPKDVMGVLSSVTPNRGITHLPSHLIDPGSKWPIRLEIHGGQTNWVILHLYRSPLLIQHDRSGDVVHFNNGVLPH